MKHLLKILLSGLALWGWFGLMLLKFIPAMLDWTDLQAFMGITGMVLVLGLLASVLAGHVTDWIWSRD